MEQSGSPRIKTMSQHQVDPNRRYLFQGGGLFYPHNISQPAPAFVLLGAFNCEIMLYFVSRNILAYACSLKCLDG
ncbi:hypothetical protein CARUB_v10015800mg [Capsella rubella]|uniref:Uncharacterized protein n=1 Tax=Capsella rubella TaxID=81985 RepID=R0HRX3_9BRAS|nr:hypothetical protein CARUB_v10015800mg [Capsella rubella]